MDSSIMLSNLASLGAFALPYLGAGVAGFVVLGGASIGISKAYTGFYNMASGYTFSGKYHRR